MLLCRFSLLFFLFVGLISACSSETQADLSASRSQPTRGKIVFDLDPQTHVIFQDSRGRHWFSGPSGVIMRDGPDMTLFTVEDGLLPGQIYQIQEGLDGGIYFDLQSGISMYVKEEIRSIPYSEAIDGFWALEASDLWFRGNWESRNVYRYASDSLFRLHIPASPAEAASPSLSTNSPNNPYAVYSSYLDPQGHIWFGTVEMGALRFDGTHHLWLSDRELRILDDGRVPGIRAMIQDQKGRMWLSNCLNTYQIDQDSPQGYSVTALPPSKMPLPYYMSVAMDERSGDLWMLTYGSGIWRFDGHDFYHYPVEDGMNEVLLWSLYLDLEGKLWVCSHNAGIFTLNGDKFVPYKPAKNTIEALK